MLHNCFKYLLSSASIIMGVVTWNNTAGASEYNIKNNIKYDINGNPMPTIDQNSKKVIE